MTPLEVLKAILKEVDGPGRPLDGNSYLPPSLVFMARDAIELAEAEAEPKSIATAIHYPDCWDQAAYPTLASALNELTAFFRCTNDECTSGTGGNDGR